MINASIIPTRLETLLMLIRENPNKREDNFFGIAEFYVPSKDKRGSELLAELTKKRWPGMHSDLLPFATDGTGNLYCLVNGNSRTSKRGAVVQWMYETYRATPIASSFDHFLDWIWLSANYTAQYGVNSIINEEHINQRLRPLFSALHYQTGSFELLTQDPTLNGLHRAMLACDHQAPASLLTEAFIGKRELHDLRTLKRIETSIKSFPEYTAAYVGIVLAYQAQSAENEALSSLIDAMHAPFVYGGDKMTAYFGDTPEVDVSKIAETLATHPKLQEWSIMDPIWDLILRNDPTDPAAWLSLAVEYANDGLLEDAVIKTQNALFFGFNVEESVDVMILLCELYDALGWKWHFQNAENDLRKFTKRFSRK